MKAKFLILLFLSMSFLNTSIAQDNKSTKDLTCVANFLKRIGAMNLDDYNKFINNKQSVTHLGTKIDLDHKEVYLHFFNSGSFFIETTENKKTLFDGVWTSLNNNNFKVEAPSVINKDVFYFNSETGEMTTIKNQSNSEIITENAKPDSKNKVVASGDGWTREVGRDMSIYDDFHEKPKNTNSSTNVKSTNEPTKWASKFGEEVLSKIDMDKMGKEMGKLIKAGLSGKPGVAKGCIRCNGTGIVKICPICNKTGKKHCRSCNGNRYTRDGRTCLTCSGTGIVICDGCKGKIYNIKCTHNIFQFQN